jgi:hypothetical protein
MWNPGDGSIDMYYGCYGTQTLHRVGGSAWAEWKGALERAALGGQRRDGDACGVRGSWDPIDPWGADGGRVHATALMALCLETLAR